MSYSWQRIEKYILANNKSLIEMQFLFLFSRRAKQYKHNDDARLFIVFYYMIQANEIESWSFDSTHVNTE